jgi:hypothetical protein
MSHLVKYGEPSTLTNNKSKNNDEDQGREYIFNDISAGMFQVYLIYINILRNLKLLRLININQNKKEL